jgi:hypothetical protein
VPIPQRTPPDPSHLHPVTPWRPHRLRPAAVGDGGAATYAGAPRPTPSGTPDLYVVVDELDELGCRLAVDAWPATDGDGRLVFAHDSSLVTVPPNELHAALSAARRQQDEAAADRPLRIGDVIAVWWGPIARSLGLPRPTAEPEVGPPDDHVAPAVELLDVTADARAAANTAAQAASADVLEADELRGYGFDDLDGAPIDPPPDEDRPRGGRGDEEAP